MWMYRCRQGAVAAVMVLSWVGHIGFVCAFWCGANVLWSAELGPIPSLAEHFVFVPMGLVVQALVPTPGGAGGGEWGFSKLYEVFGGSEVNGALGSLVLRVITWVSGLVGYLVYFRMNKQSSTAREPDSAPPTQESLAPALSNGDAGKHPLSERFRSR
jgi:uncharacterized membrane protein YbhN (UPF0104 family)